MAEVKQDVINEQPSPKAQAEVHSYDGHELQDEPANRGTMAQRLKAQYLTREGWVGDYNWGELCMPRLMPYRKKGSPPPPSTPFFGLDDRLPVLLAAMCGLQHCLAMLAGLSE